MKIFFMLILSFIILTSCGKKAAPEFQKNKAQINRIIS